MINPVDRQLLRRDKHPMPLNESHKVFRHRSLLLVVIPFPQDLPVSRDDLGFKTHRCRGAGTKATPDSFLVHQHLADQRGIRFELFCHRHRR